MKTQQPIPRFDCIDFTEKAPEGYAYAYGWATDGTNFYGLVSIDKDEVIQEAIYWITMPYKLNLKPKAYEVFRKNFLKKIINEFKEVA